MRERMQIGGSTDLAEMVRTAARVLPFTGAGISTECGIPDFRSPGGLWSRNAPIDFDRFRASEEMRREAWRRKFALDDAFGDVRPGRGHAAIARLLASGRAREVVTQNVDNLHQRSGIPAEAVIELHGNGSYAHCLDCGLRHELDDVRAQFERTEAPPACRACGGAVKSATVSFGQQMPQEAMEQARAASLACDLFLVVGSSLVVYPAAAFPLIARRNGARLAIVNREPTDLDGEADLVVRDDIAEVLSAMDAVLPSPPS